MIQKSLELKDPDRSENAIWSMMAYFGLTVEDALVIELFSLLRSYLLFEPCNCHLNINVTIGSKVV